MTLWTHKNVLNLININGQCILKVILTKFDEHVSGIIAVSVYLTHFLRYNFLII